MIGRVVSVKSKNTATVLVERTAMHPLYKKTYLQTKKYLVDDLLGVKLGDIVDFVSCRPISRRKTWKITKILGKNYTEIAKAQLKERAEEFIAEVMPEEKEKVDRIQGLGSSEETKENKIKLKKPNRRKEKLAPKP